MPRKALVSLTALAALLAAACSTAGAPAAIGRAEPAPPGVYGLDAQAPQKAPAPAPAAPGEAGGAPGGILGQRFLSDRVLVLTANLELRAVDAWRVADRVQEIALGLGGEVTGVSQSGRQEDRTATVTVRVPNERFHDALDKIKGIADVEVARVDVKGEDRTEQFIDLEARLKAKLAEEQRYLALLARAEKIDDILKIDQVLSNVRAQIEQLQGQLNALKNRSSLATITVSVAPLGLVQQPPQTSWQPGRTFQAASTALLGFLQRVADLAIWMLVWIWMPALALGFALALGRLVRPRQSPS